ncbi:MAG: DUF92 domain-containing protein [Bacteroidota bacterium]
MKQPPAVRLAWLAIIILAILIGIMVVRPDAITVPSDILWGSGGILLFMILSYASGKIDAIGAITGGFIATGMYFGGGFAGLSMLLAFFVIGSFASHWKKKEKAALGLEQELGGRRSFRHAFANGGAAATCGFAAYLFPEQQWLFLAALAASMATVIGDTLSSELGNLYGRRYLDLKSMQPGKRGLDGVISLEGSLIGLGGSLLMAGLVYIWNWESSWVVVGLAGLLGNLLDSVLGAFVQRRGWLTNDEVNFLASLGGAALGGGLEGFIF